MTKEQERHVKFAKAAVDHFGSVPAFLAAYNKRSRSGGKLDSGTVARWRTGDRLVSLYRAMRIESLTDGAVRAKSLHPDPLNEWSRAA